MRRQPLRGESRPRKLNPDPECTCVFGPDGRLIRRCDTCEWYLSLMASAALGRQLKNRGHE